MRSAVPPRSLAGPRCSPARGRRPGDGGFSCRLARRGGAARRLPIPLRPLAGSRLAVAALWCGSAVSIVGGTRLGLFLEDGTDGR